MEWREASEIIDSILKGETVLIEYTTSYIPEFLLRFFVDYSKETGTTLLIDDDFDALHAIYTHAEFIELDIDLSGAYVLKTGGSVDHGNVIARVPFHPDPRVYINNYEKESMNALKDVPSPVINLVLGLENIFLLVRSPRDVYTILLAMQHFTGNKSRKAFYVINEWVMKSLPVDVMPELERIATTIVKLRPYHTGTTLQVVKSLNPALNELETKIDVWGWRK
jgi:hypothetical protein